MQKAFDLIKERLKKYQKEYKSGFGDLTDELVFRVLENVIYIVNKVAEEYGKDTNVRSNDGWIPCSSGQMPADCGEDWVQIQIQESDTGYLWIPRTGEYRHGAWWVAGFDEDVRIRPPFEVIAWQPLPQPYVKGE